MYLLKQVLFILTKKLADFKTILKAIVHVNDESLMSFGVHGYGKNQCINYKSIGEMVGISYNLASGLLPQCSCRLSCYRTTFVRLIYPLILYFIIA